MGGAVIEAMRLCPAWVDYVEVKEYDDDDDAEVLARCAASYAYRHAVILVAPRLAAEEPGVVRQTLLHEMLHVALAPLYAAAGRMMAFVPEASREWAAAVLEEAHESVVEDLAIAIGRDR